MCKPVEQEEEILLEDILLPHVLFIKIQRQYCLLKQGFVFSGIHVVMNIVTNAALCVKYVMVCIFSFSLESTIARQKIPNGGSRCRNQRGPHFKNKQLKL
jgi:hypothetical protein